MKTTSNLLETLKEKAENKKNISDMDSLCQEAADNINDLYKDSKFYSLPISIINSVIQKVDFSEISDSIPVLKEIIVNTTKNHPNDSALLLHSIKIHYSLLFENCVSLLGSFSTCYLCTKLASLYSEQTHSVDIDYDYELLTKEKEIQKLKNILQINNIKYFPPITKVPEDFEQNIHEAAKQGKLYSVQYLLEQNLAKIESLDDHECTPLHCACNNGHLDIVQYLIGQKGANKEAKDSNGYKPLHCACINGYLDIVEYLVKKQDVDRDSLSKFDYAPIHYACMRGQIEIVKFLCQKDVCLKYIYSNPKGKKTILQCAAWQGNIDIVKFLVESGANVNGRGENKSTPLMEAATYGHKDVIIYLLKHGANKAYRDIYGYTAYDYAQNDQIKNLLLVP